MLFSAALLSFIDEQTKSAVGERLRLLKKERHAETLFLQTIWWLLGMGLDGLIAEYEFRDFKGRVRFIDFMFYWLNYRIAIEIDGFDAHVTRMDRDSFTDSHDRQNSMTLNGYMIARFSYDQILQKPMECVLFLKTLLDQLKNQSAWMNGMSVREQMVIRYAILCDEQHFTLGDVMTAIDLSENPVRLMLKKLITTKWLVREGKKERIRYYHINPEVWNEISGCSVSSE